MHKKILILVPFSEGICGVWQRAKVEAQEFKKKGHEVLIFSSNATKGNNQLAKTNDFYEGVRIRRFPYTRLGGESYMLWNFEKEAILFQPDIIIAHNYRHSHTEKALIIREKLNKEGKSCKVFLVTHAPFVPNRSFIPRMFVYLKDIFNSLNKFDKVITISKWEIPLLIKLGCKKENIEYIPNSIPEEFFNTPINKKPEKKVLYLGRIHPRKDIGTLMTGFKNSDRSKSHILEIVGMSEKDYLKELIILGKKLKLNLVFTEPIFDLSEKIKKIDSAEILVLPSVFEPFGIVFLEAMARGKLVIATRTQGALELISEGKNGILFDIKNSEQLSQILNKVSKTNFIKSKENIQKNARIFSEEFRVSNLIKKWETLF